MLRRPNSCLNHNMRVAWIGNLISSLLQNRHHKELGPFFDLSDIIHLRPFCTPIKPPPATVWSTAPIFGVGLNNRVASICLIVCRMLVNLIGPVVINSADFFDIVFANLVKFG